MDNEFEMNFIYELTIFSGLQIKRTKECNHVHQKKYSKEIIKKFRMKDSKEIAIPIATKIKLDHDPKGKPINASTIVVLLATFYTLLLVDLIYFLQ